MKKLSHLIVLVLLPFFGFSQSIPDSITTYVENRVEVKLVLSDYDLLKTDSLLLPAIQNFQKHLSQIEKELNPNESELIKYRLDSMLVVQKSVDKTVFMLQDNEMKNTGLRDEANFTVGKIKVIVIAKDLGSISTINLSDCIEKMRKELPERSAISKSLYYQCLDGKLSSIDYLRKDNSFGDFIELSLGTGASLIKNSLQADLGIHMNLIFNKKGATRYNPYISANMLYDFSQINKMNINTFLNLGYRWNLADYDEEDNMLGLEFGYLISRNGEMLDENTFRIGINSSLGNGVVINPQLYMEDNFRNFYPGIRVGFGF